MGKVCARLGRFIRHLECHHEVEDVFGCVVEVTIPKSDGHILALFGGELQPGFRRAVAGFQISPLSETRLPGGGQTKADEVTMETVFDVISFYMDAPLTGIAGGAATSFSPLPEKRPFYAPKTHPPYR